MHYGGQELGAEGFVMKTELLMRRGRDGQPSAVNPAQLGAQGGLHDQARVVHRRLKSSLRDALQRRRRSSLATSSGGDALATGGESTSSSEKPKPKGYLRIAIALTVVLVLLVVFQYGAHGAARRLGLVATTQPLTELYFSHPNVLPTVLTPKEPLDVTFTITNHEGSRRLYAWSVDIVHGTAKFILANGSRSVRNLDSRQIALHLPNPIPAGSGTVEVKLVSPSQSIDFHVNISPNIAQSPGHAG